MNQGLYKLVYSKVLNAYVPVSEAVRSRGGKSSKCIRKLGKQVWLLFIFVGLINVENSLADTVLPAGLSIKNIVTGTEIASATANSINFKQLAPKAIVDWNTLNLSQGHSFNVDMQRSWSMLNRIHDANPSLLSGNVNAAGNLYFINTNGIIFGNGAQFNVGSLYAGTLDITNDLFNTGFVSDQPNVFKPVFQFAGALDKKLVVEAGAVINAAPGGKVLLFSETVENSGIINTPDGQTILAAGKKVYLSDAQNPADPTKPVGFLVEVDSGGTATNLGQIIAERGNITMMGLAVNQQGTLSATTSVRANGSIYLQARSQFDGATSTPTLGEKVTLAEGSVTEVKPELDNIEEITKQQAFAYAGDADSGKLKKSEIKIEAANIYIDGKVAAKGGNVIAKTPDKSELVGTSIYLGNNAVIDVSGVDATAPMSRNQLSAELFSGELADNPILRGGPLFRQKVFIDARKGANGLIDTVPFEKLTKVTIGEALTKGGTIKLSSLGDVVVNKGATLDVSGGSTTYTAGNIKETNLVLNGSLVPISEAKKGVAYDRTAEFYIDKDDKTGSNAYRFWDLSGGGTAGWGKMASGSTNSNLLKTKLVGNFVDSYFNGEDAGKLDLTSDNESYITKNLVLDGTVLANTKPSSQQIIAGKVPLGGEFIASANQLTLAKLAKEVTTQFGELLDPENYMSVINTDFLANGFNQVDLSKTNKVIVDDDLSIKPNGSLALSRQTTDINANIIAHGSNVSAGVTTTIADNVTISTAGIFTNDKPGVAGALSTPAVIKAGNIDFGMVNVGKNVTLDASAGAQVNTQGKLKEGAAGNIKLTSTNGALDDSVTLQAYGFKKGGELTLGFADILTTPYTLNVAGNTSASTTDIDIDNAFFSKGGFSKYSLSAAQVNIGGASEAPQEVYAAAQTWRMSDGFSNLDSSQNMVQVAAPFVQPGITRAPVSFGFSAKNTVLNNSGQVTENGIVNLAENTTIRTDGIGGSVSLAAGRQVNLLGKIVTPSGNINISINDISGSLPYDATQAIFIGEKSSLTALATGQVSPDSTEKLLKTQIFNAGKINIDAQKGSVIIKNGAQLDVSGTSIVNDTQTVNGFTRETLHADAGSIKIGARDGLKLDGAFTGKATGAARKGSLDVGFTNTEAERPTEARPTGNREFTITQQKQLLAENVLVGDGLKTDAGEVFQASSSTDTMRGQISAQQIKEGGFDNVSVKSYEPNTAERNPETLALTSSVQLQDGLDLAIAGNLKIDAPLIKVQDDAAVTGGGSAKLTAGHVTLKTPNTASLNAADVVSGESDLTINAKQLYLDGRAQIGLAGVNKTEINTALDIHGQGGIIANGDIKLTARQIYPNTKAEGIDNILSIEAIGENSKITVNSSGEKAKPVLSAAGTLSLKADDIVQNGVLSAPFGTINLEGKNTVTLTAGSSTSISANEQIIPYLKTQNVGKETAPKGQTLPDKGISIKSANVAVKKNAVLDLSSSGKLFATEFVQGSGGSKDVLKDQANTYAILPGFGQEFSPSGNVGESVYLTGVAGLPSGNYTLLPASYALVPGAFLVEVNPAGNKLTRGETALQLDGTSLTSGYRGDLVRGAHDANWSTFKVTNGAVFRTAAGEISRAPAQYQLTDLTEFFSNPINTDSKKVPLPTDVGRLSLAASSTLELDGQVIANKGKDAKGNLGDGLQVDISAEKIRVVSSAGAEDGSLQLTANAINALKADSVLLGGTNKLENGTNKITTVAQTVSIENDNANVINTPELIVTALDTLTVKTGAVIDTGTAAVKPKQKIIETNGNGAILAMSSKNDISYSRVGGTATATNGDLNVETGSTLKAGNALVVDATKSTTLGSNPILQDGATAYFGANRILLGNAPTDTAGLNLNAAAVAALGQLKSLTLGSYNNVDIFGAFNLGNANLDLTVNAAGIAGNLANGETAGALANATPSVITAKTLTLKNTTDAEFTNPTDVSGRDLQINAATVRFEGKDTTNVATDSGKTQIAGFNNLRINADEVRVAQTGELNLNVAKTTINTGRITGETGQYLKDDAGALVKDTTTNFKIEGQDLTITKLANAKPSTEKGFGAKLDIAANNLTVASDIELASGQLGLTSTNNLNIESGANISAKSSAKEFYNITKDASAGSVTLSSTTGNVNVNTGAVVDVTSQGAANAGSVKITASEGTANIAGELKGAAAGTGKGGVLDVDVNTLANFSTTDKQATGFDEKRQYRVGTGDINVTGTAADALKARQVQLSADAGKVIVTGDIIATAPKNSRIDLYGGNGVTLTNTANLKADSTKVGEQGGKVNIGSSADVTDNTPDQLNFAAGSKVDVSGGAGGIGGEVNIIAPRTLDNTDVEIAQLATTFTGVKDKVNIVGNRAIDTPSVDAANRTNALNSANSFMLSAITDNTKGLQRLGLANNSQFAITPGAEFRNKTGSLTLASDWSLHDWRYDPTTGFRVTDAGLLATGKNANGQTLLAGVLSLRARDNINLNGTLSDAFSSTSLSEVSRPAQAAVPEVPAVLDEDGNEIVAAIPVVAAIAATGVQGIDSWAYNIVAGADFAAANPLATNSNGTGNLSLAANKGVRTGSADINIATGDDVKMGNSSSVIYTVGRVADALDGFVAPTNTGYNPLYLTDGGDISILAKGNIVGAEPLSGRQLINNYLFRDGALGAKDTTWWVKPELFKQSLATLGGGDVQIVVGKDVTNFSAILPTTARFDTVDVATGTPTNKQAINGGGDLTLDIAGNLNNGVYLVAKGDGDINVGESIQKPSNTFGTLLALQDGQFNVETKKDHYIEAVINPTLIASSTQNGNAITSAKFNSYSDTASVNLTSLLANVELGDKALRGSNAASGLNNTDTANGYLPSTLSATAFNGNVVTGRESTLLPSAMGSLELLAANNVSFKNNLSMSDADPALIANIANPDSTVMLTSHANPLLHKNNTKPVLIVAKTGNIQNVVKPIVITTPKVTKVVAGKDIKDVTFFMQNNNASDVSLIKAGEDIENINVNIAGPGELLMQATRNIDLSKNANNIIASGKNANFTKGITANVALPTKGASITLQAGLGKDNTLPNVQGYIDQYILPAGAGPASLVSDAAKLSEYRVNTAKAVTSYMRDKTGNSSLDDAQALAQFNLLDLEAKTIFANRHLVTELVVAAESSTDERGFAAIAALFPTKNAGDILMFKSKVATNSNGSIDFVAPGGEIIVGTTGSPSDGSATSPDIGVLTRNGGSIRMFANGDIQVNNSKVVTQAGGDIILYSDNGDIDAGKGSKTATSSPETFVSTDADGNTTIEVIASSAGSGIRTDTTDPDGPNGPKKEPSRGDAKLITPRGTVNASEGGIASNNLFIRALAVLNAENIQVQGVSSGVPLAASSSLAGVSAGLSPDSVNAATAAVAQSVAQSANQQPFIKPVLPSIINVEVISIGE